MNNENMNLVICITTKNLPKIAEPKLLENYKAAIARDVIRHLDLKDNSTVEVITL